MLRWLKKIFQVFLVVGVAALTSIPFKRMSPQPTALPFPMVDEDGPGRQPPLQLQAAPVDSPTTNRPLPTEEPQPETVAPAEVRAPSRIPRDPPPAEHIRDGAPPPALDPRYEPASSNGTTRSGSTETPVERNRPYGAGAPDPDLERSGSLGGEYRDPVSGGYSSNPAANPPSASNAYTGGQGNSGGLRHLVVVGDTLEGLADRYLGDRYRAEEIRAANRDRLSDGQTLPVGIEIRIP